MSTRINTNMTSAGTGVASYIARESHASDSHAPGVSGPQMNRGRRVVADGVDASEIAAAELRPVFVGSTGGLPKLMADWQEATLHAAARSFARERLAPMLDDAVAKAEARAGRELTKKEAGKAKAPIIKKYLKNLIQQESDRVFSSPTIMQKTVTQMVEAYRPHIATKFDPFMPVALGDPAARAKELVLWEDSDVMVLADGFSNVPKALVIPKTPIMFPVDADPAILQKVARIAAQVSQAFQKVTGAGPSESWVNPPQHLSVRQLHMHVRPPIGAWPKELLEKGVFTPVQRNFYDGLGTALRGMINS